jgi:putative MATE family efflux protein
MSTTTKGIGSDRLPSRDLTIGGLHRAIWYLAPPMMLEMGILNVAQVLDTYWIGQLGAEALAAVTLSATLRWVLNSMANGLGVGGMAVVARRIGASNQEAASQAAGQTVVLGFFLSMIPSALGVAAAEPLLALMTTDTQVLALGVGYLRVAFAGLFTLVLSLAINAMLRGAGEARLSMRVLLLSTVTTVVLEPVLVFGWGPLPAAGVVGSAWAYVLGYGAGLILQAVILLRGRARIRVGLHHLHPDLPLMAQIVRISLPSTVQMTLSSSSRLAIVAMVGRFGTFATAGYGVANRLLLIALIPCFGLGNAAGTLVGQNLGAGQPARSEQSAWWVSAYSAGYVALAVAVLSIFAPSLISLFDPTPQVVALGYGMPASYGLVDDRRCGGGGACPRL